MKNAGFGGHIPPGRSTMGFQLQTLSFFPATKFSPWFGGWLLVSSYCWWTKILYTEVEDHQADGHYDLGPLVFCGLSIRDSRAIPVNPIFDDQFDVTHGDSQGPFYLRSLKVTNSLSEWVTWTHHPKKGHNRRIASPWPCPIKWYKRYLNSTKPG